MITLAFLLLIAFAGMEMNIVALAIVAFLDIILLGVINSIFGKESGKAVVAETSDTDPRT